MRSVRTSSRTLPPSATLTQRGPELTHTAPSPSRQMPSPPWPSILAKSLLLVSVPSGAMSKAVMLAL